MLFSKPSRAILASLALLALLSAGGCSADRDTTGEIRPGQSQEDVRATAGSPDEIVEFSIPAEPFFGPQEALAGLLPAGTPVEEWQYQIGGNIMYVWFAEDAGESRQVWRVVASAVFPADAVF